MRTPAGFDCRFFYGNYFRGRNVEECRLIGSAAPPNHWTSKLCNTCPVPGILRANACPNLVLEGQVERRFFGLSKNVKVTAFCTKTAGPVKEPAIGCGQCHPLPPVFEKK